MVSISISAYLSRPFKSLTSSPIPISHYGRYTGSSAWTTEEATSRLCRVDRPTDNAQYTTMDLDSVSLASAVAANSAGRSHQYAGKRTSSTFAHRTTRASVMRLNVSHQPATRLSEASAYVARCVRRGLPMGECPIFTGCSPIPPITNGRET